MERIELNPIGWVRSKRAEIGDDFWGDVVCSIELDADRFTADALMGLDAFSHAEVIFYMDRVPDHKIRTGARRPRNRADLEPFGIFAQRAKGRPNRLGLSRCRVLRVDGLRVELEGLDAIDGTPVLDIKPYMVEFGPRGALHQPTWTHEIMKDYYAVGGQ